MRRLAELPYPLRYVIYALLVVIVILVLRWIDREDPLPAVPQRTVAIHVKLRDGVQPRVAMHPLFAHVYRPHIHDVRTRWQRLEVPADGVNASLAALAIDPAVEEAFVPPTITLPQP